MIATLTHQQNNLTRAYPIAFIAALVLSALSLAAAGPLRIAIIPPHDYVPSIATIGAEASQLGLDVEQLTPQQLVDPQVFNAQTFPLAVYVAQERYCYTVNDRGDGVSALLRHQKNGGVLLVAGRCWPFYRPVDYVDGEWQTSEGELPSFERDEDSYLLQQMQEFDQTRAGNFNRFFGLNIAGEGTKQFESPPEDISFIVLSEPLRERGLPERFPFPQSGDLRYRPVSPRHGLPDAEFEALLTAIGDSGTQYGPGMAVVRRTPAGENSGMVIYIWGTLMMTKHRSALARHAIILAAEHTATKQQVEPKNRFLDRLQALTQQHAEIERRLGQIAHHKPPISYLRREMEDIGDTLETIADTIAVRNLNAVENATEAVDEQLSRLADRVNEFTSD